jgi:hypothetical protein
LRRKVTSREAVWYLNPKDYSAVNLTLGRIPNQFVAFARLIKQKRLFLPVGAFASRHYSRLRGQF